MSTFFEALKACPSTEEKPRRWLYVPYDQLSAEIGPLSREDPEELGILLIESTWKGQRRPYHKQKLALVLSNMRHFALEQARRNVAVRYIITSQPYEAILLDCARELGVLRIMEPAERELRNHLADPIDRGALRLIPHEGWLSTTDDFRRSQPNAPPWRMDRFYRYMRNKTGMLMEEGKPAGGKLSFDTENRMPWKGEPPPPTPPVFQPDELTREVCQIVERSFSEHPGELTPEGIPATADDALRSWRWAKQACLPHFGPFEDAMSTRSHSLFHTRISPLLNLHRLLPQTVITEAASLDVPLASREGFIRQVLGWREFVRHVHRESDGLRALPTGRPHVARRPGDGGFGRWRGVDWPTPDPGADGGAMPNTLDSKRALPIAYWGRQSGLHCLDTVVSQVWNEAYSHHITRLMILCNLGALLDVEPRQLADWFWVAYADAYDWVVEPNVLGMGLFAAGDLMTTKPYVSGTPYINKMSDYCESCRFDPARTCPISSLYWAYLGRHEQKLKGVARLGLPLASLARRSHRQKRFDRAVFRWVSATLARGSSLDPDDAPQPS